MGFNITMSGNPTYTGTYMGLVFANGTAHTDDAFLASRLKSKGCTAAPDDGAEDKKAPPEKSKSKKSADGDG